MSSGRDGTVSVAGVVQALDDTAGARRALVLVEGAAGCPRCAEGRGCGAGLLGRRRRNRLIEVPVAADCALAAGQDVALELDGLTLLGATGLVYGLPLAGAALAGLLASIAGLGDGAAAVTALCGLGAGMAAARQRLRRTGSRAVPRIGR